MPTAARQVPVMMVEEGGRGGVADYTIELATNLAALGQPVELVTAADHLYPPMPGVRVHPWFRYVRPTSGLTRSLRAVGLGKVLNGLSLLVSYPRCARLARRCRLVHLQGGIWFPLAVVATMIFRLSGSKVVHTPHNAFDRQGRGRALRLMEVVSDKTIVHTRADLTSLDKPERACVIPHGEYGGLASRARPAEQGAARESLGLPLDAPVTLVFGQLRPDKGIKDVLLAAREVPSLFVLIVGEEDGGLADSTRLLADQALTGRVVVKEGFIPIDDVAVAFAAADTVSLAYPRASHSGVLMLAYGFHRPVIVYPVGGLPDVVVQGETGWVCDESTPEGLTRSLRHAVAVGRQECLRMGERGAELSARVYSWPEIARRTLALYDEVDRG